MIQSTLPANRIAALDTIFLSEGKAATELRGKACSMISAGKRKP